MIELEYPSNGLPYFASLSYYLWGETNYRSNGDCKSPIDKNWTYLSVNNRLNGQYFEIKVSDDKKTITIDGDNDSVKRIKEFFSNTPNKEGMKRVAVVNFCFEHPSLQKFACGHHFWGSWKCVGTMASEFTFVGRWLMLDAMRNSDNGCWLALQWYDESRIRYGDNHPKTQALLDHLVETRRVKIVNNKLYFAKQPTEPDSEIWEAELLEFYKSILEKFNCLDDPLMMYKCSDNDDCSDDCCSDDCCDSSSNDSSSESSSDSVEPHSLNKLANTWKKYGIDIYSSDSIEKYANMGMNVIDPNVKQERCTFNITNKQPVAQGSYNCFDCYPKGVNASICVYCIEDCREKHHNIYNINYVPSYCDKQLGVNK